MIIGYGHTVAELLGGERVLGASVKTNLDLARATREGLPAETAVRLAELITSGLALAVPMAGTGLSAVTCSFARDPENGALPAGLTPQQSDVVVRTASALARAIDVLGDRKKAVHWLTTANRVLGGEIPITLLDIPAGAHEVETILYGVYS